MRICMTLPDKLIDELDEVFKNEGYSVRSKGITDVLNNYVHSHKTE
ncbi:nickel responsive regulator [Methanobacterium formicicum DSM 3637]|uniref:Nickel responsive regulator n=1 Tax=Methanobacterium formicicum (strain DSM 3637 / PP1) TaxID=1204725 RepID=K2RUU7_METFP|nr:nickel responsive regulator [Methanobacterium formicicum DSM 3637]